ncbi:hypothetical protein M9Y10_028370 [Tritrichomonas musculus]|uniref:DUF4200 domain-containing protein n=1 Tax=Tritrichomonas musculus TaxID=1915356 RepID=A0ABR2KJ45_9EUKA
MSKSASSQLSNENSTSSPSIEELMQRKLRYIEKLEFEKARDVENLIQEKRQKDHNEIFERTKESFEQRIEVIYSEFQNNCQIINENASDAEMQIRENADTSFKDLRDRHIDELTKMEKEYALEVIRAHRKIVPEQLEQQRRAKELAKANDFEGAVRLRTLAEKIYEQEHIIRRQDIDKKYVSIKNQIFERQKNDLLVLNTKLNDALERNQQLVDNELKKQERLFIVSILAAKQKCIISMTSSIQVPEVKKTLSEKFDKFANDKTEEVTGYNIGQKEPPSPSKTPKSQSKQLSSQNPQSPTPNGSINASNEENATNNVFEEEEETNDDNYQIPANEEEDTYQQNDENPENLDENNIDSTINQFAISDNLIQPNEEEDQIKDTLNEDENSLIDDIMNNNY